MPRGSRRLCKGVSRKIRRKETPSICICHDTLFFSVNYGIGGENGRLNGCDVTSEGPGWTPELSFAFRSPNRRLELTLPRATIRRVQGYKVYFEDGGQVLKPHASGIIVKVNAIDSDVCTPLPSLIG